MIKKEKTLYPEVRSTIHTHTHTHTIYIYIYMSIYIYIYIYIYIIEVAQHHSNRFYTRPKKKYPRL